MSLFQQMLLGKYTKPWKDGRNCNDSSHTGDSHLSHHIDPVVPHLAGHKRGLGDWLAQKLPAQALREFASVTYEPPPIVSSDAVCLLHTDSSDALEPILEENKFPAVSLAARSDLGQPPGSTKRYRSEEEQWQLETRIARLKSARHRRSA